MKRFPIIAALPLLPVFLLLPGCKPHDGDIPYNEQRAARHVIPLSQGITLQNTFIDRRAELGRMLQDTAYLSRRFSLSNAETFNRDAIALLLNQKGADGLRIYLGTDAEGKVRLVLVPVDKSGKDITGRLIGSDPKGDRKEAGTPEAESRDAQVVETGQICPPCRMSDGTSASGPVD